MKNSSDSKSSRCPNGDPIRLVHITTVPMSLSFLRGQVGFMKARGFEVHAISSPAEELGAFGEREGIPVVAVEMPRRITPGGDLIALWKLRGILRRIRPEIVHAHTPKGGLLGMIAAWLAGVPVRVYHMRGLPLMTASGWKRALLRGTEKVSCRLAHRVFCISRSLRDVAIAEGLCPPGKIEVLAGGSGNGVDAVGRFSPERLGDEVRWRVRQELGIPSDARVVGFVGRVVRDKGITELAEAWESLREELPDLRLVVAGRFESQDPIPDEVARQLREDERVHLAGRVGDMPPLYAAMDIVALPTYREGFGNVCIEAAAMEIPVVATRIPGCVDAVNDGVNGTLVPPRDAPALAEALRGYLKDPELRRRHGQAGREWVLREFRQEAIWEAMFGEYRRLLRERGLPCPEGDETNEPRSDSGDAFGREKSETRPPAQGQRMGAILKRSIDFMAAAVGLTVLAPLMALVAMAVWTTMGRPILFRQVRPGYQGRPFTLYKFRSMREAVGPDDQPLPNAERLTRLGWFLRKTSLDELPQLWNVLRGDLSLVGPRPLLMQYLPLYSPEQARRHEVRPGITGWAQVNGRNAIGWEEKFQLDTWYVDHWSLWLDLKILGLTAIKVLRREGINEPGSATVAPFRGTAESGA